MEGYVARQPIFGKRKEIYGYELLFRDGMLNFAPKDIDGDTATSELLSDTFLSSGMYRYTGGKRAFINFTRNLLVQRIPLLFPRETTVVEILEDVPADPEIMAACGKIAGKGYTLALDDFIYRDGLQPLIDLADIIKIDFRQAPVDEIEQEVRGLSGTRARLLAEKVETYAEFDQAVHMGFDYFQGYFFAKPEIIRGKKVSTPKINLLRVMTEINRHDADFERLENLIRQDVTLSFKLLRYVNSAYYRRVKEVSSLRQALSLLGLREVKRFLSLMAMAKMAEGKPDELIRLSAIRARFCELLGSALGRRAAVQELFTLGLFSLIDAILDDSMPNIIQGLPFSHNLKDAFLLEAGNLIDFLKLVRCYESGEWDRVGHLCDNLRLPRERVMELYLDAVSWGEAVATL